MTRGSHLGNALQNRVNGSNRRRLTLGLVLFKLAGVPGMNRIAATVQTLELGAALLPLGLA
jgi:hypothetical protein